MVRCAKQRRPSRAGRSNSSKGKGQDMAVAHGGARAAASAGHADTAAAPRTGQFCAQREAPCGAHLFPAIKPAAGNGWASDADDVSECSESNLHRRGLTTGDAQWARMIWRGGGREILLWIWGWGGPFSESFAHSHTSSIEQQPRQPGLLDIWSEAICVSCGAPCAG